MAAFEVWMAVKPTASSPLVASAAVLPEEALVPVLDVPADVSTEATPLNSSTDMAAETLPEKFACTQLSGAAVIEYQSSARLLWVATYIGLPLGIGCHALLPESVTLDTDTVPP